MSIHLINLPRSPGLSVSGAGADAGAVPAAQPAAVPLSGGARPASVAAQPAVPSVASAPVAPFVLPVAEASPAPDPESLQLKAAAQKVQEIFQAKSNNLVFSLDKDSGRTVVKVVDAQTEELVRQFPSEEMLALAASLEEFQELQQGVLLKDKA